MWIGISEKVKKNDFFNLPKILRPWPLKIIFRDLTEENKTLSSKNIDIYILNFDAYKVDKLVAGVGFEPTTFRL